MQSSGQVATGFERVREFFEHGAADFGEGGGAFCVYLAGEKVVDLWTGQTAPGSRWTENTMATLMSSTKGLTALCAQILYDRGQLDIDAPVATYWPEFAQAGKEKALVRHVLNHTVGVLGFSDPGSFLDWGGRGWNAYDEIASRLAATAPAWEPGSKIGYHAISFGWLTAELVRRITGETLGEFFRDEVAGPLEADLWIGTPVSEHQRIADVIEESFEGVPDELIELDRILREHLNNPDTLMGQAGICMHGSSILSNLARFFNSPRTRALEVPAVNASGNAAGLARVYAMLSMGGQLGGRRIVSAESIEVFSAEAARGPNALSPEVRLSSGRVVQPPPMSYALGYARNLSTPEQPPLFGPADQAFGHTGQGGQVGFCDPVHRVAVGHVRNHLTVSPLFYAGLIDALYACIGVASRV